MSGLVGLKVAAMAFSAKAKETVASMSPRTKLIIVGVIAAIILFFVHQHYAHKALNARYAAGKEDQRKADEAAMKKLIDKLNQTTARIWQDERKKNVEAHVRVDARANAVLLRGPGKAVCGYGAGAASTPVRHQQPSSDSTVDAGLDRVPESGGQPLIAVPFDDAVAWAKSYSSCQVDKKSMEDMYRGLRDAWPH